MERKKCEYSNNLCQIESVLSKHVPSSVESYVNMYCYDDKGKCVQYRVINERLVSIIEGEIKKTEGELFSAAGRYLALQILKSLRK